MGAARSLRLAARLPGESVSDMSPVPDAVFPAAPPAATDDQLAPDSCDGKLSVNDTPVASDGPLLVTTIV